MVARPLTAIIFCGDRSRLGRAVLLATFAERLELSAVVMPTAARWAHFEERLIGDDRAPIQQSAPSRLDPLRRLFARVRPTRPTRDALDVAWGLPDPREVPAICRSGGIEVIPADDVNDSWLVARLAAMRADLILTGGYPQIFREPLLGAAGLPVNVHPSLLPRFRGANPVYWALATGAKETGVTAHIMLARVDAGPILAQRAAPVDENDDYFSLYGKLVRLVPEVVAAATAAVAQGERGIPQNEAEATSFREPKATNRRLDWLGSPARSLRDRVRAGRAFTFFNGEPVEVVEARADTQPSGGWEAAPGGTILMLGPDGPGISTSQGLLFLTRVIFRGVYLDGSDFMTAGGLRLGGRFT